jgi:hypothetical protein
LRRKPCCAQDSALASYEEGQKGRKESNIFGPYIPYGLFQTKGERCAKFGSDWFRNVDLYKVQTNKQTNKNEQNTISLLYTRYSSQYRGAGGAKDIKIFGATVDAAIHRNLPLCPFGRACHR